MLYSPIRLMSVFRVPDPVMAIIVLGMGTIVVVRFAAILWRLELPVLTQPVSSAAKATSTARRRRGTGGRRRGQSDRQVEWEQLDSTRFGDGRPDDRGDLPRLDPEAHVGQHGRLARVAEADVVELDAAAERRRLD